MQKFSDAPLKRCPACGGRVAKLMSMNSFQLKGSGWYVTDYAGRKDEAPPKAEDAAAPAEKPAAKTTELAPKAAEPAAKTEKPAPKAGPPPQKTVRA